MHRKERTQQEPIDLALQDRLVRSYVAVFVVLAAGAFVLLFTGRGPLLPVLVWVDPIVQVLIVAAGFGVARLSVKEYRTVSRPSLLWTGGAFWAAALFDIFYVLTSPGFFGANSFLSASPDSFSWFFELRWMTLFLLLLSAAFFAKPGGKWRPQGLSWVLVIFGGGGLLVVIGSLALIAASDSLPPLVVNGAFTALNLTWVAITAALGVISSVFGLWRYGQSGERVLGQ